MASNSNSDSSNNNNNISSKEYETITQKKKALEKEIAELNKLIDKGLPVSDDLQQIRWYDKYPMLRNTFNHPDFDVWRVNTILMGFSGLVMGGIIGYSDGLQAIKEQLKRASHNPLSASEFQMNGRKILGQNVFRSSLIYSYRLSLYTGLFLGTDLLLKNNVIGDKPLVNRTIAGCAVGMLAGYHIRQRAGPNSILLGSILGSGVGFISGALDMGVSAIFSSKNEVENKKD